MNYLSLLLLTVVSFLMSCSLFLTNADPGGSEITNGKVVARNGKPAAGLTVNAYPVSYIEGKSAALEKKTSLTGSDGKFVIDIDSGLYNLFIIDSSAGTGCFVKNVGPKIDLDTLYLDSLGTIDGIVNVENAGVHHLIVVYCKGSSLRVTMYAADGRFQFIGVPEGKYVLSIANLSPVMGCGPGVECGTGGKEGNFLVDVEVKDGAIANFEAQINISDIGRL